MARIRLAIIALMFVSVSPVSAEIAGKVIRIADGDTFTLLVEGNRQVQIRLAEIDAPEGGQPYGNRSRQALAGLIAAKDVVVHIQTQDRYGRTVGRPRVAELDVVEEMVRIGAAWVYR